MVGAADEAPRAHRAVEIGEPVIVLHEKDSPFSPQACQEQRRAHAGQAGLSADQVEEGTRVWASTNAIAQSCHGDACLATSGARLESSRAEKCAAWSQWARGSSAREAPRRRSTGRCQILSLLIAAGRLPSRRQRSMRPREQHVTWHGGWWPSSRTSIDFRRPQPRSVRADGALQSSG